MSTLERAIAIAAEAHAGQVDLAGLPYILHPLRVLGAMRSYDGQIAAALHDVVEDCPRWSLDALAAEGFADPIVVAVDQLTRRAGVSYGDGIAELAAHGTPLARAVKVQDLGDHLRLDRLGLLSGTQRDRLTLKYRPALRLLAASPGIEGL